MRVAGGEDASAMRLLPWSGTGGKPCYVVGDGTGYVSQAADDVEEIQLDMATISSDTPPTCWPRRTRPRRNSTFSRPG